MEQSYVEVRLTPPESFPVVEIGNTHARSNHIVEYCVLDLMLLLYTVFTVEALAEVKMWA